MQRISRIYLGNCGYSMAWYDGLLLDLTDPETHQPTDTIINLENGGGKTSLLSLIFSCFDTSQDRFLKHLQSRNNHFSQYFAQDGLPGFILVEWEMPSRTGGGQPYRLVIGQVVSIKAGNDAPESDRIFFSFEASGALSLESVPAPKLGTAPAASLAEFSRWIHDEQKRHPDVYVTRKQADWQRHLREERLIDLDMLQMQVNFSVQEGGFDTGFLNFTSEAAFLQKFFHLTLDAPRASAVRDAVAIACDKLRRKPFYQAKFNELTKFRGVLHAFEQVAHNYRLALGDQAGVTFAGARLVLGLQERACTRHEKQKQEQEYEGAQRAVATAAAADALSYSRQAAGMTSLLHVRAVRAAAARTERAALALEAAQNSITYVKAARLLTEVGAEERRLKELEAQAELAQEGLKPFKDHLDMQGALLRTALHQHEQALREKQRKIEKESDERVAQVKAHRAAIGEGDKRRRTLGDERAKLVQQENTWAVERDRMVASGRLSTAEEAAEDALTRWAGVEQPMRREEEAHKLEAGQHELQEQHWRREEVRLGNELGRLDAEIRAVANFIGEGNAERERLSQLPAILQAVESDTAAPDSPALPGVLERVVTASALEVSLADVRLAELKATMRAIEETGVAGNSPDVARVVARLREAGVRSARPYNEYLADALPDAERSRALVLSDPARFLGVSLAHSEMDKARAVQWKGQKLSRPVVISPLALEPSADAGSRLVAPADSDAAYNRAAAEALAGTLSESIRHEERRRGDYYLRQTGALAALEALRAYIQRFGDGRLVQAGVRRGQLQAERQHAQELKDDAHSKSAAEATAARESREAASQRDRLAREARGHVQALQHFVTQYEANREHRLERMEELTAMVEDIDVHREATEAEIARVEAVTFEQNRLSVRAESDANNLATERSRLEFYDKALRADELLRSNPQSLEELRGTYADALTLYKTNARDQLGVLDVQMGEVRKRRDEKKEEYTRDYPGVTRAHVAPYDGMDHSAMLPSLEAESAVALREHIDAASASGAAQNASNDWHRKNKDAPPATPDLEALDDAALEGKRDEALVLSAAAAERQEKAVREADRARDSARRLGELAAQDNQLAELGKSSMKLEGAPNLELLNLELASLAGRPPMVLEELAELVLEENASEQVTRLVREHGEKAKACDKAQGKAREAFDAVKKSAAEQELQKVEPELAAAMLVNEFKAACSDAGRLLEGLDDRISTTKDNLDKMQTDFEACVTEMANLSRVALSLLGAAMDKRVPSVELPYPDASAQHRSNRVLHGCAEGVGAAHQRARLAVGHRQADLHPHRHQRDGPHRRPSVRDSRHRVRHAECAGTGPRQRVCELQ